jgi:hypothetical protein
LAARFDAGNFRPSRSYVIRTVKTGQVVESWIVIGSSPVSSLAIRRWMLLAARHQLEKNKIKINNYILFHK